MNVFSSCKQIIIVWNIFLYRKFHPVQEISFRNNCLSTWKTTCCDIKFPPSSWDRKFPTLARNFFLWLEFFPVTRNFFLWQEISSFYKKIFLWPEISYCGKKFLPGAKHFLLRKIYVCDNAWISTIHKKISSCERKFLLVTGNVFPWQEISSCDKKFCPLTGKIIL